MNLREFKEAIDFVRLMPDESFVGFYSAIKRLAPDPVETGNGCVAWRTLCSVRANDDLSAWSLGMARSMWSVLCAAEPGRRRSPPAFLNPKVRSAARKRRAVIAGNKGAECVAPLDVFRRDGWVCHICGLQTERSARWPNPAAPTIDHVVPLSRGGEHSMKNIRTAHWACNSSKGSRVAEATA